MTITPNEEKHRIKIQLNLNGKYFRTYGNLVVNGDSNSKIISTGQALNNSGTGTLTVNGGYYERTVGTGTAVYNQGAGTIIINDGKFVNSGTSTTIQNRVGSTEGGTININGGVFISNATVVYNLSNTGVININQISKPITIISLAQEWKPAVTNGGTGIINIKGNTANECTSDYTVTTSGLCVYGGGSTDTPSNGAVRNSTTGIVNIDGGTYYASSQGINNHAGGTFNIKGANIISNSHGVLNNGAGIINLCSSRINSTVSDIYSSSTGTVNYSSSVVFTNGTNTPVTKGITTNIVPNYTGTCS